MPPGERAGTVWRFMATAGPGGGPGGVRRLDSWSDDGA